MDLRWCCVPNPPGHDRPEWMRVAALADDGTVYIPAIAAGVGEAEALLAASWEGDVALVYDAGHLYLPAAWLASEYPDEADVCRLIESRTRAHFAPGGTS